MAQPNLTLSDSAPPPRLGRYLLGRELGRGFSSVVYEATDPLRGRRVALKVLTFLQNLSPARRQDLAERFEREARAISTLAHPAIVAIYEVGHAEDGRQFIAMEHLEGETLRDRIQRAGPLPAAAALPLAAQIADALQYAHGRGIVHRDVKPDNVFLCPDGTARLMDFGVAHVFADDGLTQTGTVVGSPAYMSPEQINGRHLDGRSDVFSLAVTLVEALTGRKPFEGPNIPAVMNQILHRPPQLAGIASRPLRKVLERALAKNPQARLASPAAFAAELRRTLPSLPPAPMHSATSSQATTVMPLPIAPVQRPAWRTRRKAPALAAALGLAVLAALASELHHPAARQAMSTAPPSAPAASPGRVSHISLDWRRAARRQHTGVTGTSTPMLAEGESRITPMSTPHAAAPEVPTPDTRDVLRALRDQPEVVRAAPGPHTPWPRSPRKEAARRPWVPLTTQPPAPVPSPVVRTGGSQEERAAPPTITSPSAPSSAQPDSDPFGSDPSPAEDTQTPRESDLTDSPPRVVHRTAPLYPPNALARGEQGTVRLRVFINEDGNVDDAAVVESSGSEALDDAALATVLHWDYEPAFRNGRAVPSTVRERVTFSR